MRKRLRRKLRRREFTELAFLLWAKVHVDVPAPDAGKDMWDRYHNIIIDHFEDVDAFLSNRGLCSGGSIGASVALVITSTKPFGSASDEDRRAVADWLIEQPWIKSFNISGLVDANGASMPASTATAIEFARAGANTT